MTPQDIKILLLQKGWTQKELAERWGKSYRYINSVVNNPNRDQLWNDALNGLPEKNNQLN